MNYKSKGMPFQVSPKLFRLILAMKIYAVIMLLGLTNVSAKSFSQNVTLSLKNTSIEKALQSIEEQSGYSFLYKRADLPKDKSISVQIANASVEEALKICLKNQPLTYRVFQQTIVLKRSNALAEAAELQAIQVQGTVVDSKGDPLPGVSVLIKGTSLATVTDGKGQYSINAPDGEYTLVFSFIGYASQEVAINGRTSINVTLVEEQSKLNEVVVVGYGTQQKKDATGAITSIKAKDLNNVNAISIDNMIQGKAAGVQILQRTAQPGGGIDIVVRGALSPRGSNAPLYVIDGVPLTTTGATMAQKMTAGGDYNIEGADRSPLASINPNDIASIDILKDASAAAIYGSAAANGVVLITTKRGVEGKPTVSFSSSYSTQKLAGVVDGLNAQEFMTMSNLGRKERWLFDNRYAPYGTKVAPATGFGINYSDSVIAATTQSYNHNDEIYRRGNIIDNNLSISGGTDKLKYFSSFNFIDQNSLLKTTDFKRFSGRINLDQTFNKWLKLSVSTLYSQVNSTNPSIGGERININSSRQTQAALFFSPRLPLEQPDGSLTINELPKTPNPASWLYMRDESLNRRLFVAPNLQFKISPELTANVVGGYDNTTAGRENYSPTKARLPEQTQNNYGAFSENESSNISAESYLTYNKQLGSDHRLTVVGGLGYYRAKGIQFGLAVFNIPTDAVENYNLGLAAQSDLNSFFSDKSSRTKMSQFGRINYVFKDRYFVGLTARNDGSSAFPPAKKWGFFPAVSAAWSISQENFLSDNKYVNSLKIRASYGATGNESFLANNIFYVNRYNAQFGTSYYIGGQQNTGVVQTQLANRNLTWETDITANAGLDFGFLNNRLSGTFDVFERTAKDLLDFGQLPFNSSVTSVAQNVGSTRSRGFDLGLTGSILKSDNLNWDLNLNVGRSFVAWVERNPNVALNPWVGEKDGLFDIYGWETNGLFKSLEEIQNYKSSGGTVIQPGSFPGNPRFIDQNDDGVMNQFDVVKLGNSEPKFNFGFGTSLRFKAFDLNLQAYGFVGRTMGDGYSPFSNLYNLAEKVNQNERVKETWSSTNPNGTRPGVGGGPTEANNPTGVTDYFLTSVNFLRLKNLTLGYNLPTSFLQNRRIARSARVFVDFQNLAVFSNYNGIDPEMEVFSRRGEDIVPNASPFPIARTAAFGLNVTF